MSQPIDSNQPERNVIEIDRILAEVRERLPLNPETGDHYELLALQLLLQVTKAMHSERDTHQLLTIILDSALSFAAADRAFLMLIDPDERPAFKLGRSYAGDYLSEEQFVISMSAVQEVLSTLQPVMVPDTQTNETFSERQSIRNLQIRTIMAAPLVLGEETLGLLYVDSKRPLARYTRHHLSVINSLAEQAAVAIYNAQK